ncbi:uncharacterized protein [Populus alba]|uniref:uncharacterized protein isoform X4 n=1 Tax=Populus alba TaxID=43335 RepID=UPI003CC6F345
MTVSGTPRVPKVSPDHVSLDIAKLAESVEGKLKSLRSFSDLCFIYRVPKRLRELNEKAYTPQVISIGPFHHGKKELQEMEEQKRLYLRQFLELCKHHCKEHSMIEVTHDLLSCKWDSWVPRDISKHFKLSRPEHFVGYLAICQRPSQQMQPTQLTNLTIPSVAELHQAGMKFKLGSSINLLDIKFDDNKAKDVEILVQNGILENGLPDNEAVASLFRNLSKENTLAIDTFYYSGLVEDLNKYCRKRRHKWKAALKQKYFDNPWTITSLVAATVLLILTIMQTVCSIIQIV